jgi:hypothetical protein
LKSLPRVSRFPKAKQAFSISIAARQLFSEGEAEH